MISRGLGLERYRAYRLGEGGLVGFERQGGIGVFPGIEAKQVDGAQWAKLDGRLPGAGFAAQNDKVCHGVLSGGGVGIGHILSLESELQQGRPGPAADDFDAVSRRITPHRRKHLQLEGVVLDHRLKFRARGHLFMNDLEPMLLLPCICTRQAGQVVDDDRDARIGGGI